MIRFIFIQIADWKSNTFLDIAVVNQNLGKIAVWVSCFRNFPKKTVLEEIIFSAFYGENIMKSGFLFLKKVYFSISENAKKYQYYNDFEEFKMFTLGVTMKAVSFES